MEKKHEKALQNYETQLQKGPLGGPIGIGIILATSY
jgi:hypothetical protein